MDWTGIITALLGALLGGGGVAAWVRARGQNATDYLGQVQSRVGQLETRSDEQDKLIGTLMQQNAELTREQGRLEGEKAAQDRNLTELRTLAQELTHQIGELSNRVASETQERARAVQAEQIAKSKAEFLERENNALRHENERLKRQLPPRGAIPASSAGTAGPRDE